MEDVSGSRCGAPDGRSEGGREVRWSARRKEEVVLRLLRGETLDALARETGQADAGTISSWREEFLQGGHEGLKSRPAPIEDRRLADAQRKIGYATADGVGERDTRRLLPGRELRKHRVDLT
jgi:transposase-like protein